MTRARPGFTIYNPTTRRIVAGMSQSLSWYDLVPEQRKTVCYFASGVYIYHLIAMLTMIACWKYVNKRIIVYSSIVLVVGIFQYSGVQILCYIDYLVDFTKCNVYARLTTILGDVQHLSFDIYQMRKILPLIDSMVKNSIPLKITSWVFFGVRIGCAIAKNVVQLVMITPPIGGYTQEGIGLCATFNTPSVLVAVRVGSFSFELLLFGELIFIIYKLREQNLDSNDSNISKTTRSIGRLLDVELILFVIYFVMDGIFLVILLIQNVGQVIPFATIYNAVLPTIILANVLCNRWIAQRFQSEGHQRSSGYLSTSPTDHDSRGTSHRSRITSTNASNVDANPDDSIFEMSSFIPKNIEAVPRFPLN